MSSILPAPDRSLLTQLVRPLVIASLLTLALYPTLIHVIDPQALPQWLGRYWTNGYCRFMLAVFGLMLLYGLLQWIGITVERRALGPRAGRSVLEGWLAFLSGRDETQGRQEILELCARWRLGPDNAAQGPRGQEIAQLLEMLGQPQQQALAPLTFAIWALPMLGFIGTVLGISQAIGGLAQGPAVLAADDAGLGGVFGGLAFAFDTTLVGLVCVIPLALLQLGLRLRIEMLGLLRYRWLLAQLASEGRDESQDI